MSPGESEVNSRENMGGGLLPRTAIEMTIKAAKFGAKIKTNEPTRLGERAGPVFLRAPSVIKSGDVEKE